MKLDSINSTFSIKSVSSNEASSNPTGNITNSQVEGIQNQQRKAQMGKQVQDGSKSEKLSEKAIKEAIENTNKKLTSTDRKFEFSVNEETNDIIVKVINKETDEVIREIPSEKILDMVAKMMELAGLFIDEKR